MHVRAASGGSVQAKITGGEKSPVVFSGGSVIERRYASAGNLRTNSISCVVEQLFGKVRLSEPTQADGHELVASFRLLAPQTSSRRLAVFSDINPSVDPEQVARIIIAMAREQLSKERGRNKPDSQ